MTDLFADEKEGGLPCRNSLPLFLVIDATASADIDSPSMARKCVPVSTVFLEFISCVTDRHESFQ